MHAMLASMPHACERLTHHPPCRLLDIVHADQKLYLVFEFLDVDLKRYMEAGNSQGTPLTLELCQVCAFHYCLGAPAPPPSRRYLPRARHSTQCRFSPYRRVSVCAPRR